MSSTPSYTREQMRRIGEYAAKGIDHTPKHLRFVTWTLKYSRCHWLQILGLDKHYARAELEARINADGSVEVTDPKNISRFAILRPVLQGPAPSCASGGGRLTCRSATKTVARARVSLVSVTVAGPIWVNWCGENRRQAARRTGANRRCLHDAVPVRPRHRSTVEFDCADVVRGEFKSLRSRVGPYFRGRLPVKNDTDVT